VARLVVRLVLVHLVVRLVLVRRVLALPRKAALAPLHGHANGAVVPLDAPAPNPAVDPVHAVISDTRVATGVSYTEGGLRIEARTEGADGVARHHDVWGTSEVVAADEELDGADVRQRGGVPCVPACEEGAVECRGPGVEDVRLELEGCSKRVDVGERVRACVG
jgi:hypothetical protein